MCVDFLDIIFKMSSYLKGYLFYRVIFVLPNVILGMVCQILLRPVC